MSRDPKELSPEEMKRRFFTVVMETARYWADLDPATSHFRPSGPDDTFARYQVEGFAHSLFSMLDGANPGLPAFNLVPHPHESDQEYRRERGDDWWPDANLPPGMKTLEGGEELHAMWNEFRHGTRFQAKPTHVFLGKTSEQTVEVYMYEEAPYVICPVDAPERVEALLPEGWTVGHSWWNSSPSQKQADGRWKLLLWREEDMMGSDALGNRKGSKLEVVEGGGT